MNPMAEVWEFMHKWAAMSIEHTVRLSVDPTGNLAIHMSVYTDKDYQKTDIYTAVAVIMPREQREDGVPIRIVQRKAAELHQAIKRDGATYMSQRKG